MKAAVVEKLGKIITQEVGDPPIVHGSMKIKVEACAVCGSDVRIFRKGDPRATLPRIIGHEIAGVVVEVGEQLVGYNMGDRVTVAPLHGCGECRYCLSGRGNICINPHPSIGYASSGGFAQFIVPPVNVVNAGGVNQIPDGVSFEDAAMAELLACCINGQEKAGVRENDVVAIIGVGPAGCMHIQLSRAFGASRVICIGRSQRRLDLAKRFNPQLLLSINEGDIERRIKEETDGIGADVVIVAAPSAEAQETAFSLAAPYGRINFFGGLPKDNHFITVDANNIHYRELFVSGASSSLGRQNADALQLIAKGKVNAQDYITHRFGIDDIGEAFRVAEMREGLKVVVFPWQ